MAIVKMNKIILFGLESQKEQIIEDLMTTGVVEIRDVENPEQSEEWEDLVISDGDKEEVTQLETSMSKVKEAIDYLLPYNPMEKGLFRPKRTVDADKLATTLKGKEDLWQVVEEIESIDDVLTYLKNEENRQNTLISMLKPWENLDIPIDAENTKNTVISLGTVPLISSVEELQEQLKEAFPGSYLKFVSSDKDQKYLMVLYHAAGEEQVSSVLKKYSFSKASFREIEGTAGENISKAEKHIKKIYKEREEETNRIAKLSSYREDLEVLYDHLTVIRDRKKILEKIVKTESTFLLEGWFPEQEKDKIMDASKKWDCIIDLKEPEKDEEFPILLKNNKFVQPFELITELYSLPNSKGIDPNFIMAPFFFVFFGMMVSDAGYGLAMAVITGIILLKFKIEGMASKLLRLVFLGGISTFIWGVLFGGWFADIATVLSGGEFVIPPIWFDPLDDPMRLLIWSFIFGGIQLYAGLGAKGYMMIKEGKPLDALFDIGFWYITLTGVALLFVGGTMGEVGKYMAIVGAILLVLTQGRSQKGIIKKFFSGILSLYDAVGFMSDILSYSRLLALGLATGVIGSVINAIGSLLGFNVIGIIVLILVFIGGHTFNIAINALGAYVHASRLQYVEFFGKFYEGGGKPYEPFKIDTKYTKFIGGRQV